MSQDELIKHAEQASQFLKLLCNKHRLLILCLLIEHQELTVTQFLHYIPISQSALSQHLAKMREDELLGFRKESLNVYYHIKNPTVFQVIKILKDIYCP